MMRASERASERKVGLRSGRPDLDRLLHIQRFPKRTVILNLLSIGQKK